MSNRPETSSQVRHQLNAAERLLAEGGAPFARRDAVELLCALLGEIPAELLGRPERRLTTAAVRAYGQWIARRRAGEAIPSITGHLPFMDLDLLVTHDTPLPPPCAARMVEIALACARRADAHTVAHTDAHSLLAAELGTGSGAIALALAALEPRFTRIYAVESSSTALQTATANGGRYLLNLVITWRDGSGVDAIPEPVALLLRAVCGRVGSPEFAELTQQAPRVLRPGGALICGLDSREEMAATQILKGVFPTADVCADAHADGVIVVVQTPRADAAFNTRR